MRISVLLLLSLTVLASCTASEPVPTELEGGSPSPSATQVIPSEAPSIRGIITALQEDGRVRIEENPSEASGSGKAVVRLDTDTRILYRSGKTAAQDDLETGQRVSAWFVGPVMESYPVQAAAGVLVIEP